MNSPRVAALFRELADAIENGEGVEPETSHSKHRPRALTRPSGEATSIVTAQAAKILRERGFR